MNFREAILEGAKEANRLHRELGTKRQVEEFGGRVDVFGAACTLGSNLIFRDLTGILGAYIKTHNARGIMVTTQRRLPIQRFTGAHELGHYFMNHEPSIDGDEILGGQSANLATMENQANGFAAEFIAPRWLIAHHAKSQGWDANSVTQPDVVYQLGLRLGLSYEATGRALQNHHLITPEVRHALSNVPPKSIKRRLLPAEFEPKNWYGDVWVLTESDKGTRIEGHPDDWFVFRLHERWSAGYLWDIAALRAEGFDIVTDGRVSSSPTDVVGGSAIREITAGSAQHLSGVLNVAQRRPWLPAAPPLDELNLSYELLGEERGMPRAERRQREAA